MAALYDEEAYGYQLLQRLSRTRGLAITESTVYPILLRLEKEGWIKVRVASSPSGPPRRYYSLTALGRERLGQMKIFWADIRGSIDDLMEGRRIDE
jgi:PadR family transcriptional regulator PadR